MINALTVLDRLVPLAKTLIWRAVRLSNDSAIAAN
jgi:hypothetical protein